MGKYPPAILATIVVLATLAASACSPATPAPTGGGGKTILIGAALPITGGLAPNGKEQQDGYDLWKNTVNAKGGIDVGGTKYKIDIKYYDYKSDTTTAVKLVEKLITEDKAQFIFGPYGSGATLAASAITEKYQVPMISPSAASEEVFQKGYKYLFGILIPNGAIANQLMDVFAAVTPKPRTIAIISRNDLFPTAIGKAAEGGAKQRGIDVVYSQQYPPDAPDLSTPLAGAKAANPDIVLGTGYINDLILMTKQAREQRLAPKAFIETAGPSQYSYIESLKDQSNLISTVDWWSPEAKYTDNGKVFGSAADYSKTFQDTYKIRVDYINASSSASGVALQEALQKAGSTDPQKVRDALSGLDMQSFYGHIKFNESGQNIGSQAIVLQIQNQSLKVIFPGDIANGTLVYPIPSQ